MFKHFPLAIKLSSRIKITEDERQKLITSYNDQLENGDLINLKLGMNNSAFLEMVKGRDSISVPFILRVQSILGIEIVSRERLTECCREYIEYIFNKSMEVS
jgi:hypothetical protein